MVGIDETTLSLMLYPTARPPLDPATGKPVERVEDRIEKLLEDLDADNERIILPTPALSEFLVLAGKDAPTYLDKIHELKTILIKPFDEIAAIELAAIEYDARTKGDKRSGTATPWAKVKFDRQIVAVAKVNGAKRIYSDDEDVFKFAARAGLEVISTWELPLPVAKQITMKYGQNDSAQPAIQIEPVTRPASPPEPDKLRSTDRLRAVTKAIERMTPTPEKAENS